MLKLKNEDRKLDRHPNKTVINDAPSKKILGSDCFTGKVYQTFKEQMSFIVYKFVPEKRVIQLIL